MLDPNAISAWLLIAGALVNLGVVFAAIPHLQRQFREHQAAMRAELDHLWEDARECRNDRRGLSERIIEVRTPEVRL
jgi:hypothetical protein